MNMPQYDPRYLKGIELFNNEEFFEAHEAWESIWLEITTEDRKFYQGLIQVAATFVKVQANNRRGALSLYETSRAHLTAFEPHFQGLNISQFIAAFDAVMHPIRTQQPDNPIQVPEAYPKITLNP